MSRETAGQIPRAAHVRVALGLVLLGGLAVQSFHMVEHVAQVFQKFVYHVPAHGLLGEAFDREWVHLAFNGTYEVLLLAILFGYILYRRGSLGAGRSWGLYLLYAAVGVEGYHVGEHVIKVIQYLSTGVPDTPGFIGNFLPPIWVHFTINLAVLLLLLGASLGLRLLGQAWRDVGSAIVRRPMPSPVLDSSDRSRSRISQILILVVSVALLQAISAPSLALPPGTATVKIWPASILPGLPHDFIAAPDGTIFFTLSGAGQPLVRLDPRTNQITMWPVPGFHAAIGPAVAMNVQGQVYREQFTVAIARLSGHVLLLLPNSGVLLNWQVATELNEINVVDMAAGGGLLWFTLITPATDAAPEDSTEIASLDPATNVLTRYNLPQDVAGSDGFIGGLSYGGGRLWFGATTSPVPEAPFAQKTGVLDPLAGTATIWPLFLSSPYGPTAGIGRATTYSSGSVWTLYHSNATSFSGAYELEPELNRVTFYGAAMGTPSPSGPFLVSEKVDRATTASGGIWGVSTFQIGGNFTPSQAAEVVRWQSRSFTTRYPSTPQSVPVSVSASTLIPEVVTGLPQSTATVTPDNTAVPGVSIATGVTMWTLYGKRHLGHFVAGIDGKMYFGLRDPLTDELSLAQLSA